jgi:hypothetical protein
MKAETKRAPKYWVLVLANKNQANSHYNAQVIFDAQLKRKAWGLKEGCRNFDEMEKGDICLLYIGSPYCAFAGYAVVGKEAGPFGKRKQNKYLDKVYKRKPKAGVEFTKVVRFDVQVPVTLMIDELNFIKNKKNWGLSFLGSVMPSDYISTEKVLSIACMLNKALGKKLKPKVRSKLIVECNEHSQGLNH